LARRSNSLKEPLCKFGGPICIRLHRKSVHYYHSPEHFSVHSREHTRPDYAACHFEVQPDRLPRLGYKGVSETMVDIQYSGAKEYLDHVNHLVLKIRCLLLIARVDQTFEVVHG
jgi:hypothetical protein